MVGREEGEGGREGGRVSNGAVQSKGLGRKWRRLGLRREPWQMDHTHTLESRRVARGSCKTEATGELLTLIERDAILGELVDCRRGDLGRAVI